MTWECHWLCQCFRAFDLARPMGWELGMSHRKTIRDDHEPNYLTNSSGTTLAKPAGGHDSSSIVAAKPQEGAFVSGSGLRGASPLQVDVLRPVVNRNCVAARRGGEHRKTNGQSATKVNSIRPGWLASLPSYGEAQSGAIRKPTTLRGNVSKRSLEQPGGWRQNGWKS